MCVWDEVLLCALYSWYSSRYVIEQLVVIGPLLVFFLALCDLTIMGSMQQSRVRYL